MAEPLQDLLRGIVIGTVKLVGTHRFPEASLLELEQATIAMGQQILNPLNNGSISDLKSALAVLAQQPGVDSAQLGAIGFCMGGALSLYAASENSQVGACVVFYGIHPKVKPDLANLQAPVLGIYAERDSSVPPEAVRELERQLKELGKPVEVHIYPNTDHAFFNDQRPDVYNQKAAADAWRHVNQFFAKHL